MDDQGFSIRAYVWLAAVGGAITALAFRPWQKMTKPEIALTLFVGFSFSVFCTPWFAHEIAGFAESDTRALAALTYIFASGSNILLPVAIRFVTRAFGLEKE
jgi:hypothetical protein